MLLCRAQAREARAKKAQSRRAKKLKSSEGETGLQEEHSDEASDSHEDSSVAGAGATKASSASQAALRAKRILAEYWGPKVLGRNRYSQRLFDVLYSNGTKHTLVAEDVVDGWAQPFESNQFRLRGQTF